MFFSIVVPVYNVEKYLRECIDSILRQTFTDFELILVDDGSTDNSPLICDDYAQNDGRIKVIHKQNGGQAEARNIGTKTANGKYIIYIDSDDYIIENTFLQDLYEIAKTGIDIICYKFRKYYDDTKELSDVGFKIPEFETQDSMALRINKLVANDAFYCAPWSKTIKLSVIKDNAVEFKSGLLSEDQEWYYNVLINSASIEGIDKSYIAYRQRSNSNSNTWKIKNLTDTIDIIKNWKEKMEASDLEKELKLSLLNSLAKLYCNLLIGYTRYNNNEKKQYYQELRALSNIVEYHINPRVNTFYKIYKIGGFGLLMSALKVICKIK